MVEGSKKKKPFSITPSKLTALQRFILSRRGSKQIAKDRKKRIQEKLREKKADGGWHKRPNAVYETFEVAASPEVMDRFKRFLALLVYNGGHSASFGISFDGDGPDYLDVKDRKNKIPGLGKAGSGMSNDFEMAWDKGYAAANYKRKSYFVKYDTPMPGIVPALTNQVRNKMGEE